MPGSNERMDLSDWLATRCIPLDLDITEQGTHYIPDVNLYLLKRYCEYTLGLAAEWIEGKTLSLEGPAMEYRREFLI